LVNQLGYANIYSDAVGGLKHAHRRMTKVAIVHDHLAQDGGAERVVQVFRKMYPAAPIFTLVHNPTNAHKSFHNADIRTSFIQRLPGGTRFYQWYLPLMPTAIERFDLSEYDLVISNTASFAKGVITLPKTLHLSYIHSPTRYLWSDTISYVNDLKYPRWLKMLAPHYLSKIRLWDRLAADRPDFLLANSGTIQRRISKYYRRPSTILYPPVETHRFSLAPSVDKYFVTGGRLVPYKRFDLTINAFNKLGLPLKIYGTGPMEKELRAMAHQNIEFLGRVPDDKMNELYGRALAFINPQEEDFGITVLEAMAAGRPVIAYAAGGALETVKPGVSGEFFEDQEWESLANTVLRFKPENYEPRSHSAGC
jgi:glycosyltransferase involved in cell wall biosynthesis